MATTTVSGTFISSIDLDGNFDFDDAFTFDWSVTANLIYYCCLF